MKIGLAVEPKSRADQTKILSRKDARLKGFVVNDGGTPEQRFVRAETFFALARTSPATDPYPHLERADLLAIAPLTANTLAKLAHGLADDVLTEAALAGKVDPLIGRGPEVDRTIQILCRRSKIFDSE